MSYTPMPLIERRITITDAAYRAEDHNHRCRLQSPRHSEASPFPDPPISFRLLEPERARNKYTHVEEKVNGINAI